MRLYIRIVIGALVPIVGYFGYDSLMGHLLVRKLCARDGGLKIYETTFVEGYLDESETNPYACLGCFWKLARHEFKYVDVHARGRAPEYFRLSLARKGDLRCQPSRQTFCMYGWDSLMKSAGIPDDQCVAVEALSERPAGAVLTETRTGVPNAFGVDVRLDHFEMKVARSERPLAEVRNYLFYAAPDRWFNFAGGDVPEPAAMCGEAERHVSAVRKLTTYVIKEPAKKRVIQHTGSVQ